MHDETTIQDYASETSLQRGEDYYQAGNVLGVARAGSRLFGSVQGSEFLPYSVYISLEKDCPKVASCDCLYDWGGHCKHIVAVFLTYVRNPHQVKVTTSLEERLAFVKADELRKWALSLIEQNPKMLFILKDIVDIEDFSFLDHRFPDEEY